MSFTGNLNALLAVWYAGGTVVTSAYLRPRSWLKVMARYAITNIYLLPTKLRLLMEAMPISKENTAALSSLRMIFAGSQMLDTKLMHHLQRTWPQVRFILYYGASELNYVTYCTAEEWLLEPNTVGRTFPGVRVTVDEDHMIYVTSPYTIEGVACPFSVGDKGWSVHRDDLCSKGAAVPLLTEAAINCLCRCWKKRFRSWTVWQRQLL